jgi:RNA polymerase sigma factor (sigma-70 family)
VDVNQLVAQLRAGDDSAGAILVSVVLPRLLGYAAVSAPDMSIVDQELVVERAIEKAIEQLDRYDSTRGTFVGWVRGFVRYGIADWHREQPGYRKDLPEDLPDPTSDTDGAATPGSGGEDDTADARSAALASLVLTLSEGDQLLVQLRFTEQLPHAVIADRLGVSESACRKRLERVLKRLRDRATNDPDLRDYAEGEQS